jgi:hypothetical protein
MLVVATDMNAPPDFDTIRVEVAVGATVVHDASYTLGPGAESLPSTLALVPGSSDTPADVRVIARQKGKLRVAWRGRTVVPRNRVAALRIDLSWSCEGRAKDLPSGVESDCDSGFSCVGGECVPIDIGSEKLPTFDPAAVGPNGTDGRCLPDAVFCDKFERSSPVGGAFSVSTGVMAISADRSTSPSRSLLATLRAVPNEFPTLTRTQPDPPLRSVFEVSIAADSAPATQVEVAKLTFGPNNYWDVFAVAADPTGLRVLLQTYNGQSVPATSKDQLILTGSQFYGKGWHKIRLRIDESGPVRKVIAEADGVVAPSIGTQTDHAVPSTVRVELGMPYVYGDAFPWGVYYDDVSLSPPLPGAPEAP